MISQNFALRVICITILVVSIVSKKSKSTSGTGSKDSLYSSILGAARNFTIGTLKHLISEPTAEKTQTKVRIKSPLADIEGYDAIAGIKRNVTSFVILYTGSQGSSWFVESLSEYKGVCVIGNELIDRVTVDHQRFNFIDSATRSPRNPLDTTAFLEWKKLIYAQATEQPSKFDKAIFGKCNGTETVFGYKV